MGAVREEIKASQVQPANATRKNNHCWVLSIARVVMGFGMGFIGGIY